MKEQNTPAKKLDTDHFADVVRVSAACFVDPMTTVVLWDDYCKLLQYARELEHERLLQK